MPSAVFIGADGEPPRRLGLAAAGGLPRGGAGGGRVPGQRRAAGAAGGGRALRPIATREAEVLGESAGPPTCAELWRLAAEHRLRPVRALTGTIWEAA